MKAFVTKKVGLRFVPTADEAAVLGEAAQVKMLTNEHWVLTPANVTGEKVRGISLRTNTQHSWRYQFGPSIVGIDPTFEHRDMIDLETSQCKNGYMMRIPDGWLSKRREAERREVSTGYDELKVAVETINATIEASKASALIRDGRVVLPAVTEI